jgi:hypothetical protein
MAAFVTVTEPPLALEAATFHPHVGSAFALTTQNGRLELMLATVEEGREQPGAPRAHPFTLTFTAARGTGLPQGTDPLAHPVLGELGLFLVPRQPLVDGLARYEALFN